MYKIGEFANICRTTTKTLRLYDKMGILSPDYIDENTDYRYYNVKNVSEYNKIKVLKKLGFTLEEIKNYFSENKSSNIVNALDMKENELIKELNVLNKQIEELKKVKFLITEDIYSKNNLVFDGNVNINIIGLGNLGCKITNQLMSDDDIHCLNYTTIDYDLKTKINISDNLSYDHYYKDLVTSICSNHINIIIYNVDENKYLNNFISYLNKIINEINTFAILILIGDDIPPNNYNTNSFIDNKGIDCILRIKTEKISELCYTIQHLIELLKKSGVINIEYIDFINFFTESKQLYLGVGKARGKERAVNALKSAISDSLVLKSGRVNPNGLYVNVSLPTESMLDELNTAINILQEQFAGISIIWGAVIDKDLYDDIIVSLIVRE